MFNLNFWFSWYFAWYISFPYLHYFIEIVQSKLYSKTSGLSFVFTVLLLLLFWLQGHDWLPIVLLLISLLLAGFSVTRAVTSIERVNSIMMPLLLLVLLVSFYWSLTLKYASHGITYLFTPDWGELPHYFCQGALTVQGNLWVGLAVPRHFC